MCNAFDKYLETFRRNVIFVDDKSVLQLSQRLAALIAQIRNLAKVLSIHPDGKYLYTCFELINFAPLSHFFAFALNQIV